MIFQIINFCISSLTVDYTYYLYYSLSTSGVDFCFLLEGMMTQFRLRTLQGLAGVGSGRGCITPADVESKMKYTFD
jgi:hypothetical protein